MNAQERLSSPGLIPESAPFTREQRAWLSGFFTASLSVMTPERVGSHDAAPSDNTLAPAIGPVLASNDDAPWHDPVLAPEERTEIAKDRSLAPRLMAAMAQQDCGQCGYNCADYANAIFKGDEGRLNLCSPGGKITARLLKSLALELGEKKSEGPPAPLKERSAAPGALRGFAREAPAEAAFLSRRRLTSEGSEKDTWHVEFDLYDSGLTYEVGDSLGVFAKNNLGLVDQVIAMLGAAHTTPVLGKTLREALCEDLSLGLAPDALFELFSFILGGTAREKARALARGDDPDGDAQSLDILAALQKFPSARPHPEAFVDALDPLQPRLYSISSSPRANRDRLSLTVDSVRYVVNKRKRLGVASTFLADGVGRGDRLKVFVQKSEGFRLPQDETKPVIMVGPGTGVAPFRAFLQERQASGAQGRNWLFFGHRSQLTEFFYREELEGLREAGVLTRLSLAWSRDADHKFYVQDRMRETGADIWSWLEKGAYFYVCGDAKRMARDVEAALVDIIAKHGPTSVDGAIAFVTKLKKEGRFQLDVY